MNNDIEKRIFQLFSVLMDVAEEDLDKDSNPNNIEKWDSLSHIKMLMEIEAEFNIELLPEEAVEIFSINDVVKLVTSKMI